MNDLTVKEALEKLRDKQSHNGPIEIISRFQFYQSLYDLTCRHVFDVTSNGITYTGPDLETAVSRALAEDLSADHIFEWDNTLIPYNKIEGFDDMKHVTKLELKAA